MPPKCRAACELQYVTPQKTVFSLRNVFVPVKSNAPKAVRKQIHLQFISKLLLEAIKMAKHVNSINLLSSASTCWLFCSNELPSVSTLLGHELVRNYLCQCALFIFRALMIF